MAREWQMARERPPRVRLRLLTPRSNPHASHRGRQLLTRKLSHQLSGTFQSAPWGRVANAVRRGSAAIRRVSATLAAPGGSAALASPGCSYARVRDPPSDALHGAASSFSAARGGAEREASKSAASGSTARTSDITATVSAPFAESAVPPQAPRPYSLIVRISIETSSLGPSSTPRPGSEEGVPTSDHQLVGIPPETRWPRALSVQAAEALHTCLQAAFELPTRTLYRPSP